MIFGIVLLLAVTTAFVFATNTRVGEERSSCVENRHATADEVPMLPPTDAEDDVDGTGSADGDGGAKRRTRLAVVGSSDAGGVGKRVPSSSPFFSAEHLRYSVLEPLPQQPLLSKYLRMGKNPTFVRRGTAFLRIGKSMTSSSDDQRHGGLTGGSGSGGEAKKQAAKPSNFVRIGRPAAAAAAETTGGQSNDVGALSRQFDWTGCETSSDDDVRMATSPNTAGR